MQDAGLYFGDPAHIITPFLTNRYLWLWEYFRGGNETQFVLWQAGSPFVFNAAGNAYAAPWGADLVVSGLNGDGSARPLGNHTLLHIDDPGNAANGGFQDVEYPGAGTNNFTFLYGTPTNQSGVVGVDINGNGTFAPYTLAGGTGAGAFNLQVDERLTFCRDLLRVEISVRNLSGSTRRVGCREILDPDTDGDLFFLPETRNRIRFETDYGRAVGTVVPPRNPQVPNEWELYLNGTGTFFQPSAKGILRGNGATTPDRVVFGNGLNMFPRRTNWTYNIDPTLPAELTNRTVMIYWDAVPIGANRTQIFTTYIGLAGAAHGMSNFFVAAPPTPTDSFGFVGAAQSPFGIPLVGGDADTTVLPVTAFFQNEANTPSPNSLALITLPDSLAFADPADTPNRDLGTADPVQTLSDELSDSWQLRATGIEAGISPVDVLFSNGFGDTAIAHRLINVPQGRLYRFQDNYQMLTFPFTYTGGASDPATALGLPAGNFIILRYNPIINDYVPVTELQPGLGYWVRMLGLGDTMVRASSDAVPVDVASTGPFRVQLQAGWNMVGNPSPYAVPVREIQFLAPPLFLSFDQAVARGYIRPTLYQYNRLTGLYEKLSQDAIINPGRGIWIYSTAQRIMLWPAPYGPDVQVG